MISTEHRDLVKQRKAAGLYNMIPNLFWSVLNLAPVSIFCYRFMDTTIFVVFQCISLITLFLPRSFFDRIQIGHTASAYKKTGVQYINRFTQNGDIINRWIRKKYPQYNVLSAGRRSIQKMIRQTYFFEKFHLFMFIFFSFATLYALWQHYFLWALVLTVTNIIYNVYPNLLQQYIRVRLTSSIGKMDN